MRKVTTLALAGAGARRRGLRAQQRRHGPRRGLQRRRRARRARGAAPGALGAYGGTLPGSNVSDRVLFAVDQTTLEPGGDRHPQRPDRLAERRTPTAPILIEGHADERGTGEYNMALGSSRASAVRNYMVSQGIPDSRISIITYGRERPVATCDDESCWSQNRRAVTVVTGGAGA